MCYKLLLMVRVRNLTRDCVLAEAVEVADTSRKRRAGLLKRQSLPSGEGLWIAPCEAVHTIGMRFSIDVLYLDRSRKVLKIRHDMVPGRLSVCLRAYGVLELPAGTAAATRTAVGDQLQFQKVL
jgi:hypothetical protein